MTALAAAALWFAASAGAQTIGDAQKRYDAGDYRGAAAAYETLLKSDRRNPALHYDLGSALFKDGRLGPAIASYQRAYDILPRDADIRYNLDFALRKSGEELVPAGVPPLLFRLFHLHSERELAGLQWIFCWSALLIASLWLQKPDLRQALFPWGAWAAALWLFYGGWWAARRTVEPAERGVIVKAAAEIRSGPGDKFGVSVTAPEGRRVEILGESEGWLEIGVLKEGAKGWLPADAVERI